MSCHGFDDKVEVATEFRALARRADVACPCRPSRNLWRCRDYTPFPISFCNKLVASKRLFEEPTCLAGAVARASTLLLDVRFVLRASTAAFLAGSVVPR